MHEQAKKGTAQLSVLLQFDVRILSHLRPRLEIILLNFDSHKKKNIFVCVPMSLVGGGPWRPEVV